MWNSDRQRGYSHLSCIRQNTTLPSQTDPDYVDSNEDTSNDGDIIAELDALILNRRFQKVW